MKELKSRKIYDIYQNNLYMTKERTAMKFRVKKEFMKKIRIEETNERINLFLQTEKKNSK